MLMRNFSKNGNHKMLKKYSVVIMLFLLVAVVISIGQALPLVWILGIVLLFFILGMALSSIFEKHKQAENPRPKIAKDVLILVLTFLAIIFLGGLAGMFANHYASPRFGTVAGFVSALAASFVVGYLVKKGVGKVGGRKMRSWK
jgi:hypothetical protein